MAILSPSQAHLVPLEDIPESVFSDPGTAVLYPDDAAVRLQSRPPRALLRCVPEAVAGVCESVGRLTLARRWAAPGGG